MEFISTNQNTIIYGKIWKPQTKPIGMIQIIHGITEHMGRYEKFADYFNKRGYLVFGIDVIGHGHSLYQKNIKGYFGKEGSWQNVVDDVYQSYLIMKAKYPEIPCFLVGFSMGSFIARTLLIEKNSSLDLKGCFLLGTGSQPIFLLKLIRGIVKYNCKKVGEKNSSHLIDILAFETYNKKFSDLQSSADWLLKYKKERDIYLNDELCLSHISTGLFRELLSGMVFCCQKRQHINIHCPVYLLSGKDDAVGDFGKGIIKTLRLMKRQGVRQIDYVFFNDMRHDILHEYHHLEVFSYIEKQLLK